MFHGVAATTAVCAGLKVVEKNSLSFDNPTILHVFWDSAANARKTAEDHPGCIVLVPYTNATRDQGVVNEVTSLKLMQVQAVPEAAGTADGRGMMERILLAVLGRIKRYGGSPLRMADARVTRADALNAASEAATAFGELFTLNPPPHPVGTPGGQTVV